MNANDNLVLPKEACPACGERDADCLLWIDDYRVRCDCGTEYEPGAAKGGRDA